MKERKDGIRVLLSAFCCVLGLCLTLALSACGGGSGSGSGGGNSAASEAESAAKKAAEEEKAIRETIAEVMESFKNPTEEKLKKLIGDSEEDFAALIEYGIDPYEFMSNCLKKFDYKVGDVTVDGDTAVANVSVTNADMNAVIEAVSQEMTNDPDSYAELLSGENGMNEFMQVYFKKIYEQVDKTEELVTTDVRLDLSKESGEWDIDDDSITRLVSGMFGGIEL